MLELLSVLLLLLLPFGSGPTRTMPCSQDGVAEFYALYSEACSEASEDPRFDVGARYGASEELWYNVTPPVLAEAMSARIFKHSKSCESVLLLDGALYPLGLSYGGLGFHDAVPWDYDGDGQADILYTYSFGSGIHRSMIAVFDTRTRESLAFADNAFTSENAYNADWVIGGPTSDGQGYRILDARGKWNVPLGTGFAGLSFEAEEACGEVRCEDGTPVLLMYGE